MISSFSLKLAYVYRHSLKSIQLHIKLHTWLNILIWVSKIFFFCFIVEKWILPICEWFDIICSWLNRIGHLSKFALLTDLLVGDISLYSFYYFFYFLYSFPKNHFMPPYCPLIFRIKPWPLAGYVVLWALQHTGRGQKGTNQTYKQTTEVFQCLCVAKD